MGWSLEKAEWHCGQTENVQRDIEKTSICFSKFINECPEDYLVDLIESKFGRVYKLYLERCCKKQPEESETIEYREELSQKLRSTGFKTNEGQRLLLAIMPFYPQGSMKVEQAIDKLPDWIWQMYEKRYEERTREKTNIKNGLKDRIFLNRILGLSNLYYIDPEDKEILEELKEVRMECIDLILKTKASEFGGIFNEDFGDRYWAMAQSGIQNEELSATEIATRDEIQHWLTNTPNSLKEEGGIQRFAAAILFSKPGSVQIANPDGNLPKWYLEGFKRFNSLAGN